MTGLEPLPPRGLRLRVHLDGGDALEVALEAVERMALGVGDALPEDLRRRLLEADAEVRIRDAALGLLAHRARTRHEVRRKLLARGFRPAGVDTCLDRLEEQGLLDDPGVAAAFVRDRIRHRPRGRGRLAQELRAKGVAEPVARSAVERVLEDEAIDEADLAWRVAEGWLRRQAAAVVASLGSGERSPEREKARRRLYGHLARRGFAGPALSRAMERAAEWARAGADGAPPTC